MSANFIPPIPIGQFKPSSEAIASWLYEVWKYLQENPIPTSTDVSQEAASVAQNYVAVNVPPMISAAIAGLEYSDLVNNTTLPVYRASNDEIDNTDLLEAWAEGCRFALVDDEAFYIMIKNGETITLLQVLTEQQSAGVVSVNGQTGVVVIPNATGSAAGLMSASDKANLTGLFTGYGAISDLNDATATGLYLTSNTAQNRPADYCDVYVFATSTTSLTQIAVSLLTGDMWARSLSNGTWKSWKRFVTSVNSQTGDVVIANATSSDAGLMSASDKANLTGLLTGYGAVSDLNNATATGLYLTLNTAQNRPADYCEVYVFATSTTALTQIAISLTTGDAWARGYSNGTWKAWRRLSTVPETGVNSGATIGNYIANYGCSCFVPYPNANEFSTITITTASIFGTSGNKSSEATITQKTRSGFTVNFSSDYSGMYASFTFTTAL